MIIKTEIHSKAFLLENVLNSQECQRLIDLAESKNFESAPISSSYGPVIDMDLRNNDRVMWNDDALTNSLWQKVEEFVPKKWQARPVVGFNERIRFYRYTTNQHFTWHYDGEYQRENGHCSFFSVLLYLNDEFEGGATEFEFGLVKPKKGSMLVFRHTYYHQGAPVISGTKYVLRTDLMYDRLGA
jgi:prolyl 4-hydroxylase